MGLRLSFNHFQSFLTLQGFHLLPVMRLLLTINTKRVVIGDCETV